MLKFGVYRMDQFRALQRGGLAAALRSRLTRGRISLQLLAAEAPLAEKVALFNAVIPGLLLSSGVFRTTFRGRFQKLDAWAGAILADHFPAASSLDIHDWAASDCSTTADWAAAIWERYPEARLTASDLTLFLIEAALPGGPAFVVDPAGGALQYIRPPFVVRLSPPERPLLAVNWLLCRRALSRLPDLWRRWAVPADWIDSAGEVLDQPPYFFRKISLIHPEAQALAKSSSRFTIRRHSAFDVLPAPCDVIRSMNIFNPSYFDPPRLREGVAAVWRSLRPGGLWIIGRTWQDRPPLHRASVFVKRAAGFERIGRYEEGSEIDDLVLTATF